MQAPPGKTLQPVMRGLLGVLAQGMVEQGVYTLEPLEEAREIFVQFGTTCLTQGGGLPRESLQGRIVARVPGMLCCQKSVPYNEAVAPCHRSIVHDRTARSRPLALY